MQKNLMAVNAIKFGGAGREKTWKRGLARTVGVVTGGFCKAR
jgi:hypothetical protein